MIGSTLSHYRIEKKLGEGGMGEVYLAEDTRLGRRIALKILSGEFTQHEDRVRRFQQEARAASALNHPNIITIYDIGRADGIDYIATEYIDGKTLRQLFAQDRMALCDVLDVMIQVAGALAVAHASGIVHRDIKPENIMLRPDGYVKVLDFGLAKLLEQALLKSDPEASTMAQVDTAPGALVGTMHYMSPEQARGWDTDARTDVFSLGAVMYEVIAGHRAFGGPTSSDVIVSILEKEPLPLARYSRDLPEALEWIVSKALRKNREERYQSVKDLLIDLKNLKQELEFEAKLERSVSPDVSRGYKSREPIAPPEPKPAASSLWDQWQRYKVRLIAAASALILAVAGFVYWNGRNQPINSVAVLPFVNESGDADTEYLSDGIAESIINSLSQIPTLRVMARPTMFRYKGQRAEPQQVGRELGVRAILTGRVLQRGDRLSIQADLVNVADGTQLWGRQYNRSLSDVLIVQQEIAQAISDGLRLRLTGEEQQRLTKRYTENTEAYQLYLKGRYYWNKRTEDGLKKSIEYFQQAVEKEPAYALAYAGIADAYALLGSLRYGALPPKDAMPKAKTAAMKALDIDDTLAEAYTSLGLIKLYYDWNWDEAERAFQRAIDLNPNYATAHHWYGLCLLAMGQSDKAVKEAALAQQLDPLSLIINTDLGNTLYRLRRYNEAIEQFRKTIELDPNFFRAHLGLGLAYEQQGRFAEATASLQQAIATSDRNPGAMAVLGHIHARAGRKREARKMLNELNELAKRRYVAAANQAIIYIGLGDNDAAFRWLQKSYNERASHMIYLSTEPIFDSLRADPRLAELIRRVGLVQ